MFFDYKKKKKTEVSSSGVGVVSVRKVGFIFSDNYVDCDTQKCLISPQKLGFQRPGFF